MTFLEFVLLLLIAGICGALGRALAGSARGGILVSIALGFVGALLGSWLARQLDLPQLWVLKVDSMEFPVVWTIVGSALFVALLSLLSRGEPRAA